MTLFQTFAFLTTGVLLALSPTVSAFTTPCVYEGYRCGYNMVDDYGYTNDELTTAVNATGGPIPPLTTVQLLQVLFRCNDIVGGTVGNSYCIAGCVNMGGATSNDQCAM
ncbi:hypothetical protein F5883DRAFT_717827 [Diaporthe sp. PMI_573]|nr:hypothetical protein F5883DRAFT_717827 [Diaporthaceae sp. PMI_573]